jgi:hypothetical protein
MIAWKTSYPSELLEIVPLRPQALLVTCRDYEGSRIVPRKADSTRR